MYIKEYDLYKFGFNKSFFLDIRFLDRNYLYPVTSFLHEIYSYNVASWYEKIVQDPQFLSKIGTFYGAEVTLDINNNLVYISDADGDDYRIRTKNITQDMIIEFCKNGSLEYVIMTKLNFIHLVSAWAKILENEPQFALLYLDDKDWYDVFPFNSQEAMEKFVEDHTKTETMI